MKIQIVGLPLRAHNRLKDELSTWAKAADFEIRFVPSFHRDEPQINLNLLNRIDQNVQDGYVHIAVVPTPDWKSLQKSFRFDCRVARLVFAGHPVRVEWQVLQSSLESVVAIEKAWRLSILPTDLRHALLLPPPSFATAIPVQDFWKHCDVYDRLDQISAAATLLADVGRHHRRSLGAGQCWIDKEGARFKSAHALHGRSQEERKGRKRFRFCFEVIPGFHFDVDVGGQNFWKSDANSVRHKATHMNIDPWGNIRC